MDRGQIALEGPSAKVRDDPELPAPACALTQNERRQLRERSTGSDRDRFTCCNVT